MEDGMQWQGCGMSLSAPLKRAWEGDMIQQEGQVGAWEHDATQQNGYDQSQYFTPNGGSKRICSASVELARASFGFGLGDGLIVNLNIGNGVSDSPMWGQHHLTQTYASPFEQAPSPAFQPTHFPIEYPNHVSDASLYHLPWS